MPDWKGLLRSALTRAGDLTTAARSRLKAAFRTDPIQIVPYLGHGTAERLTLTGRVLEDEGLTPAADADTAFKNLLNFYKRLGSDEVPGARVRARFGEIEQQVVADREGYFRLEFRPDGLLDGGPWHDVELELLDPPPRTGPPVRATGSVLVPPDSARFGVISDIDDTVLWTNVGNKLKMVLTVALLNERTRLPFKGVAAFYQALQRGASTHENNPIFYVSSSPWNLYDLLVEFFNVHGIPRGPLFLRDLSARVLLSSGQHHGHKLSRIEPLFELYPKLPFVLIGDSGEQDPEIYCAVMRKYPGRVRVIYIRSVNPDPARVAAIDALVEEARAAKCQLVLTPDSEFAAAHAAAAGLIATDALADVRADKGRDEQAPSGPEVVAEEL